MEQRTIAAIATPLGEGSIATGRISGQDAPQVVDRIFKSVSGKKVASLAGYTALYGSVYSGEKIIDNAVVLNFKAPKSYTGENVVEISVHGGRIVIKNVLRAALDAGAFLAEPGEFTKRAFLNGKLDLVEAEAVMGIISAHSKAELDLSFSSLSGKVSSQINDIKEKLVEAAASIAFFADYPDEELPELNNQNFYKMLTSAHQSLNDMLSNFDAGKILREGVDTAIVGKPNVGKSTLMNLLSHKNRSIVTEIAGTTRDIIEDTVMVGDVMLNLADTAGIHKTDDVVESVGVKLAQEKKNTAQLILAVFDLSRQLDDNDLELLNSIKGKNAIVVLNKTDISGNVPQGVFEGFKTVLVSAKNGLGEQELVNAIAEITKVSSINPDSAVLGSERQRGCALRASSAISAAINALESGTTIDAVGVCIDDALAALYELTGERATNTVTNEIFKRFCVGK